MHEYILEIDELHDDAVVLILPALCLLVYGRTLDEALNQMRASIGYRLRDTGPRREPTITFAHHPRHAYQSGRTAA